ncbi:Lipase-like protein [Aphelenchoides bicaudatus]|nr:Lipase-like protein [Aphelenchoides bicaudatus]
MIRIVLLFILQFHLISARFEYNDTLSRTKFFPIAAGAYNDNPTGCLKNRFGEDAELINVYPVDCDADDTKCFSYVGISHQDKAILVGCRGTMTTDQLLAEILETMLETHVSAFDNSCLVSEYFFKIYNRTWEAGLKNDISGLTSKYNDYDVWVSGHSLGAAICSVTATAISYYYPKLEKRIKLINFGQPRIGDFSYALLHNIIVPNSYRLTHHKDLIINLPPLNPLWFFHPKTEVFFNNDMDPGAEFKICEYDEDFSCSNGQFGTSVYEHRHYYKQWVFGYGQSDCSEAI